MKEERDYYYLGEFGFFILEIIGGLEEYFEKNKEEKINVTTFDNYAKLLKFLFPKNIIIKKEISFNGFKATRCEHDSHINIDSSSKEIYYKKGFGKNLKYFNEISERKIKNKPSKQNFIYLKKPINFGNRGKKDCISLFPRNRDWCAKKNLNKNFWTDLIKEMQIEFPNKKIVVHGARSETLLIQGKNIIYPKDVLDQIEYLNRSIIFVSPDSGLVHFALACGCDVLVIGNSYWPYLNYNPFGNQIRMISKKNVSKEKIIKMIKNKRKKANILDRAALSRN